MDEPTRPGWHPCPGSGRTRSLDWPIDPTTGRGAAVCDECTYGVATRIRRKGDPWTGTLLHHEVLFVEDDPRSCHRFEMDDMRYSRTPRDLGDKAS